jgi:hypothetical protein
MRAVGSLYRSEATVVWHYNPGWSGSGWVCCAGIEPSGYESYSVYVWDSLVGRGGGIGYTLSAYYSLALMKTKGLAAEYRKAWSGRGLPPALWRQVGAMTPREVRFWPASAGTRLIYIDGRAEGGSEKRQTLSEEWSMVGQRSCKIDSYTEGVRARLSIEMINPPSPRRAGKPPLRKGRRPHSPLLTKEGQGEVYISPIAQYWNLFLIPLYQGRAHWFSPLIRGR